MMVETFSAHGDLASRKPTEALEVTIGWQGIVASTLLLEDVFGITLVRNQG